MKTRPKITVIIPAYNAEELLPRALDSVPRDNDIQLVLLDDGSTDSTWKVMVDWWREQNEEFNQASTVHRSSDNRGVAKTMNLGFSLAAGEYIVSLSSDDYYLADFEQFRPYLDGKNDLIYFDLEVNDRSVWHITPENKSVYVGAVKFIRRKFLGDTRIPDLKYKEDKPFFGMLQAKNPKEVFTGIVLKHYNWPHEGSLSWQAVQDYENDRELWAKNAGINEEVDA